MCHEWSDLFMKEFPKDKAPKEHKSDVDTEITCRLQQLEQQFSSKMSSLQEELRKEKSIRLELEEKYVHGRSISPDSKGSLRRQKSIERPCQPEDSLEPINLDAVAVQPDFSVIGDLVAKYQEVTKGDKHFNDSVCVAEELGHQPAEEKLEERRKLREKRHMLLFAC